MGKIIRITEAQFKRLMNEAMCELSPELANKASDAAFAKGDSKRGEKFYDYANDKAREEFKGGKVFAHTSFINYHPNELMGAVICKDGGFAFQGRTPETRQNKGEGEITPENPVVPEQLKTQDETLARKLANWWSRFGEIDIPILSDPQTYMV